MTIFTLGICGGSFIGSTVAGVLSDHYGWRTVLIMFGVCGLPLGAMSFLLIKEPARGATDVTPVAAEGGHQGLWAALLHIYREKALLFVILGGAAICTWGWGLLFWTPAFLVREFGLTTGQSGAILGRLHLVGGTLGTLLIAIAMHWLSRRAARVQIWFVAGIVAAAATASVIAYAAKSLSLFVICLWLFAPVLYIYAGPTYSLINNLTPPQLRAKVVSIFLFATSLGYLILAPMFIGYCSDLFAHAGTDSGTSLRRAMSLFAPLGFLAATGYAVAGFCASSRRSAVDQR